MRRKKRGSHKGRWIVLLCFLAGGILIACGLWSAGGLNKETLGKMKSAVPYAEVAVAEESLADKFYYRQLPEEDRVPYKEILQGIRDNVAEIYLHGQDAERANALFQCVLDDFPEIFWCDGNAMSTAYNENSGIAPYVVIEPKYTYSGDEKEALRAQTEAAATECMSGISREETEYAKIKYVYEYLINTVDYQLDASDNQNIVSALVNKASVCAGYARSTQYLLEKMGIYCIYVTGKAMDLSGNMEEHAWNLVRCDGNYYYVDTTWGDPVFQQEVSAEIEHAMTYDYLCCSGAELEKTHTLSEGWDIPACESGDLNYYKLNGMYYDSCDGSTLLDAIYRSIEGQQNATVFKFANSGLYGQAHDLLLNDLVQQGAQYLGSLYGLDEIPYFYEDDQVLDKITLYWFYEN